LTVYPRRPYPEGVMDVIPIKPERKAQLEEYAQRRGQDTAAALDGALAEYLEWREQDFEEAVAGIRQGHEDVKAGRTQSAAETFEELRVAWPSALEPLPRQNKNSQARQ